MAHRGTCICLGHCDRTCAPCRPTTLCPFPSTPSVDLANPHPMVPFPVDFDAPGPSHGRNIPKPQVTFSARIRKNSKTFAILSTNEGDEIASPREAQAPRVRRGVGRQTCGSTVG